MKSKASNGRWLPPIGIEIASCCFLKTWFQDSRAPFLGSVVHGIYESQNPGTAFLVNGGDYPTQDGTCVRDYIHVQDLAQAHFLALKHLLSGAESGFFNLGNGHGYSIREVIKIAEAVTGKTIPYQIAQRRSGDPAVLLSSSEKAKRELGWKPQFTDLGEIITTAWRWHSTHPAGY